jgi:hypothetical protein
MKAEAIEEWNLHPVTIRLKKNIEKMREEYISSQIDAEHIKEVWLYAQQAGVIETLQCLLDDEFISKEDSDEN